LRVIVGAVVLLDELAWPLYRPVVAWFASLALIRRAEAAIAGLPPYAVLVILAVPVAAVEPLKLLALVWMASGRVVPGVGLMILAYAGSFLLIDRIYHAGREKLFEIAWFRRVMTFVDRIRRAILDRIRASALFAAMRDFALRIRAGLRGFVLAIRAWLGRLGLRSR
jgi:hypothetical protein